VTGWLLAAAVALLVANGFFVAVEFALIASRRAALEPLADAGDRRARRALGFADQLNLQLAGSQLGITMASLGLGAVAEPALASIIESGIELVGDVPEGVVHAIGFGVALTIVVFAHMVVGEMVPKNIAITAPERTLLGLSGLNRIYVTLFGPVIRVLNALANGAMRLFGVEPHDERVTAHTADELARLLADSRAEGILEGTAHDLLAGALDLGGKEVASVMVPADRVVAVDRSATVAEAEAAIVDSGVTRLLVRAGGGPIIGFVHAKDLLALPGAARDRPIPMGRIRRVLVLEATAPLDVALVTMRWSRTHVATVVDPSASRQFVGLATLEDVLESIVGDIRDETDDRTHPTA
jgi:CBS domain containing-hemolysin-like protein